MRRQWRKTFSPGHVLSSEKLIKFLQKTFLLRTGRRITICSSTVQLCFLEYDHDPKISDTVTKRVYHKTGKHFIIEHRTCTARDNNISMKNPSKISTESLRYKLVPHPHFWINPLLCFNNDDTTFASTVIKDRQGVQVYLRSSDVSNHYSITLRSGWNRRYIGATCLWNLTWSV